MDIFQPNMYSATSIIRTSINGLLVIRTFTKVPFLYLFHISLNNRPPANNRPQSSVYAVFTYWNNALYRNSASFKLLIDLSNLIPQKLTKYFAAKLPSKLIITGLLFKEIQYV